MIWWTCGKPVMVEVAVTVTESWVGTSTTVLASNKQTTYMSSTGVSQVGSTFTV